MPYGTVNADVIGTSVANSSLGAGNASNFKNRIINGSMTIDQRNGGASVTQVSSGATYTVDRWNIYGTVTSKFTAQQNAASVTPPAGYNYYLGITSSSAYSVSSTDEFTVTQPIEGFNTADLGWGTANAQAITLSFWVRSSLTGTFGGTLRNSATSRSYPFTYTISAANTWEQKSVTIAGDTSGTWLTTNGVGIYLTFGMGQGSTFSATAGAWGAGNKSNATGATSVVGTNGATWYVTGVQLEVGSSATGFEYRDYGRELILCQRYYYKITGVNTGMICSVGANGTGSAGGVVPFPVTMRASPTFSQSGLQLYAYASGTISDFNSFYISVLSPQNARLIWNGSGFTTGQWIGDVNYSPATAYAAFTAEL